MTNVRHSLDYTDRRIAASLLASPRASWREIGRCLGLSERTVVRRAVPLYGDGTLRATAVRNPAYFPGAVPIALRIRCRPNKIRQVANALSRRPDTIWVDILGGGDEISAVFFLDNPDNRNALLLRDLPATDAVVSWTAHTLLRVFRATFHWTAGLLTAEEAAGLAIAEPEIVATPTDLPAPLDIDTDLIAALVENGRITYTDLADRIGTSALTARRRLDTLLRGNVIRLATEVDLALLGVHAEALLWISVQPAALERVAETLAGHPLVRFVAATTGTVNLMVAVATTDLSAIYAFLIDTIGPLSGISAIDTTPILATAKRTGLARRPFTESADSTRNGRR
ncbi:Lrp/AsnC family transcriptional regulator [Nocardia sp. NPDC046763]|uniref:Lrp/AsnC family transcriptional regulator n=1 Tax=Nocardia sp. NPDC046763 TaxID=3155256 RepID=UPI0033D12AB1